MILETERVMTKTLSIMFGLCFATWSVIETTLLPQYKSIKI